MVYEPFARQSVGLVYSNWLLRDVATRCPQRSPGRQPATVRAAALDVDVKPARKPVRKRNQKGNTSVANDRYLDLPSRCSLVRCAVPLASRPYCVQGNPDRCIQARCREATCPKIAAGCCSASIRKGATSDGAPGVASACANTSVPCGIPASPSPATGAREARRATSACMVAIVAAVVL